MSNFLHEMRGLHSIKILYLEHWRTNRTGPVFANSWTLNHILVQPDLINRILKKKTFVSPLSASAAADPGHSSAD